MPSPFLAAKEEFATSVINAANASFGISLDMQEALQSITIPESSFGDISSSLAFVIAKQLKKNPKEIATKLAEHAKPGILVKSFSSVNGYVNAYFDETEYSKLVIGSVLEEADDYGSSNIGKDEKVIVEYPSVNPTKPWHVGHLRNALLGDAIANMLEFCGYRVERENYIDDLGLQMAETLWGYLHISKDPKGKKFDQFLGEQYVEVNRIIEQKGVQEEIDTILKRMELGNTEEAKIARRLAEECVKAQYETSFAFGIYHDVLMWESNIVKSKLLESALSIAKRKGILEKVSEGDYKDCLVLDLEKAKAQAKEFENPKEKYKVLIRSNGVATYAMKDFAFHLWKFGLLMGNFRFSRFIEEQPNRKPLYTSSESGKDMAFGNAKKVVNIIDMGQSAEQDVVKALLELTAQGLSRELVHVAYGKVELEKGTLSGRKGGWLGEERNYTADDLLKEAIKKVLEKTKESKKVAKEAAEETAKRIALSAIKFEYLRVSPEKGIVFSWENALNLQANSGPYVMYMYARARRILEKGEYKKAQLTEKDYKEIGRGPGFELIKIIGNAQDVFTSAAISYRPNTVAEYLLRLSALFSGFYEKEPVLGGGEARNARLAIVYITMQTIANGMLLLGITPAESM
ncbi:MAG: arginine--tRNA ligase [Candidatus Micrarchaeaceae archaeon]